MHPLAALLVALAALTAAARAQYVNRATWLGADEEGMRPNFTRGTEYYLDRASYVIAAPWWDRGTLRGNQARWFAGSTSATQFTFEGQFDFTGELGDGASFGMHVLQSENRDTRFFRNALELEYRTGETTAIFAQGEVFADKSLSDVSLGFWALQRGDDGVRVMLTAVDWTNEKSRDVEYTRDPYAAMVSGAFGDADSHRVLFEVGAQLPFTQVDLDTADRFELQRYIGSVEGRLLLCERDWVVASVELEHTRKHLRPAIAGDPLTEDLDRVFDQWRLEWWRDTEIPWSIGVLYTHLSEDGKRPFDAANDLRDRRREWFGIVRTQIAATEKLAFEPQLWAGVIDSEYREGAAVRDDDKFDGKLSLHARWAFSPKAALAVIVSTEIDEVGFGGGGAQFTARF